MANITMSTHAGFTTVSDKGWRPTDTLNPIAAAEYNPLKDIPTIDAALVAANGTYWTSARLTQENIWDKLYWIRVNKVGASVAFAAGLT